jgi:hypothetical protein
MNIAKLSTRLAGLAVVMVIGAPVAARACSPVPGYIRPTSFELLQIADAVVVARAAPGGVLEYSSGRAATFQPEFSIKGPLPDRIEPWGAIGKVSPSDPKAVGEPHPDSMRGACIRQTFTAGARYVLFLDQGSDGAYRIAGHPFTPVAEDYAGEASPWTKTLRAYLAIQTSRPPEQWSEAMMQRLKTLMTRPRSAVDDAEALDAMSYLVAVSPNKPTADLVEAYRAVEAGRTPRYVVDERDFKTPGAAFASLLAPAPFSAERARKYRDVLLHVLAKGEHPAATPVFDELLQRPAIPVADLEATLIFLANNGQYRRAYGLIETRALAAFVRATPEEAGELLTTIGAVQQGPGYSEDDSTARWRSDPYVAAAWPRLALDLNRFMRKRGDVGYGGAYSNAIAAIPSTDYRANPERTRILATSYDQAVLDWAKGELTDEPKRVAWAKAEPDTDDDPAALPVQVAVLAFGEDRDALLAKVVCQSPERRNLVVAMFAEYGGRLDRDWLTRLALAPGLNEDDWKLTAYAAARLYGREVANAHGLAPWGYSLDWLETVIKRDWVALGKSSQIGEPRLTPVACP